MDYEKKYKEALERARKLLGDLHNCGVQVVTKDVEAIFPELAESEDEKIRKELKTLFLGWINGENPPLLAEPCNRYIAWLEKQGKESTILKDQIESLQAALVAKEEAWKIKVEKLQKSVEWGEEDSNKLHEVIHRLEHLDHFWNKPIDDNLINWLKSLRPQPKQEFDKEDQETLRFILEDLCDELDETFDEGERKLLNRKISLLQSLKTNSV